MNLVRFPIITLTLTYITSILIADNINTLNTSTSIFALIIALLLLFVNGFINKRKEKVNTYSLIFSVLIIASIANFYRLNNKSKERENSTISSEFILSKIFYENDYFISCVIEDLKSDAKYLSKIYQNNSTEINPGDYLYIKGESSAFNNPEIPENFNFNKYLSKKGIHKQLNTITYTPTDNSTINSYRLKTHLERSIDSCNLNNNSKALFKALVLGNKNDISDEVIMSFSDSGIMHLLALSGLHIGILTFIILYILKPLRSVRYGNKLTTIIVLSLLWSYAYITGLSASIMRATIMFSIFTIAMNLKRVSNVYNSLAIAALILLTINPSNIFDTGVQLSFSAVIGIVSIYPILNRLWIPKNKIIKYFSDLLLISIAAQIATLPLTIFYFHKFSSLFFIANIVEIPLITFILPLSYIYLILIISNNEVQAATNIYDLTVIAIENTSSYLASFDLFVFKNIFIDKYELILWMTFIVLMVQFIRSENKKILFSSFLILIIIQIKVVNRRISHTNSNSLMLANNELLISKGNNVIIDNKDVSIFKNWISKHNSETSFSNSSRILLFNNTYYYRVSKPVEYNPITVKHSVIVFGKHNPNRITNNETQEFIYTGKDQTQLNRYKSFCSNKGIVFHNSRDSLYRVDYFVLP